MHIQAIEFNVGMDEANEWLRSNGFPAQAMDTEDGSVCVLQVIKDGYSYDREEIAEGIVKIVVTEIVEGA